MKIMQKLKNKKGFTLVELLVVLVILAILAAAIIPSMMGFIDKAKEESAAAECRSVLLASQVILNEDYGTGTATGDTYTVPIADITAIADLPGLITGVVATKGGDDHYFISAATYKTINDVTYGYVATSSSDGQWTRQAAGAASGAASE